MVTETVLRANAIDLLIKAFGVLDAERFITSIKSNNFDWSRRGTYPAPWGEKRVCTPECNFSGTTTYPATRGVVDLANEINEPMTGRKWIYKMFPLSFAEMVDHTNLVEEQMNLENRLLYGYYPDVVRSPGNEREILNALANDNLYKDIFKWENIKKPLVFEKLVKALAMQVGSQVSINELSNLCAADNKTIERYIRLLEQTFTIFRLGSFSTNLRNELKSSEKYYFYDVGIRNAVIGAFEPVGIRQDMGHLFENFVIAELAKKLMPGSVGSFGYFWRTTAQQEVDFVTESGKNIIAYEIKWNPKVKAHLPKTFIEKYNPVIKFINRENFHEVLI